MSMSTPQHERSTSMQVAHAALPFIVGGCSGMTATICIQPIDMVKVRLQLSGEGAGASSRSTPFSIARQIVSQGRVLDLYQGLSAGLLRQVVYGTGRLGFFFTFEDMLKRRAARNKTTLGFRDRVLAGVTAGALGSFIGTPTEVALIRMQSDGLKPIHERVNFRSVFHALAHIVRGEGVFALWNGCVPTVIRAMSTNLGQLACFSEVKHQFSKTSLSPQGQTVLASIAAGFCASFFSLPFDFVKTRLQRQTRRADGTTRYKNTLDCFVQVAREEGLLRFYRGFGTYFMRMAPHS